MGVSLKTQDQSAGGLLDDRNVEFKDAKFVLWDYEGASSREVPALMVTLQPYNDDWSDEDGDPVIQYWSAGDPDKLKPSKDGLSLESARKGEEPKISRSSNFGLLMKSIVDAGFDEEKIGDTIDVINGMKAHVARRPQPKRAGLKNAKEDANFLAVSTIHEFPYDEKPAKGKAAGKGKGKAKDTTIEDKADETLLELLEKTDPIKKSKLSTLVFQARKNDEDVKEIVKLVVDDDYLSGDGRPFDFDGTAISSK